MHTLTWAHTANQQEADFMHMLFQFTRRLNLQRLQNFVVAFCKTQVLEFTFDAEMIVIIYHVLYNIKDETRILIIFCIILRYENKIFIVTVCSKWPIWQILSSNICCCLYCVLLKVLFQTCLERSLFIWNEIHYCQGSIPYH